VYLVGKYFDVHECSDKIKSKKPKTETAVNCTRCSGTFSSEDEYVCHQFLGCRETPPQYCEICDKTFPTKYQLQRHINGSHVQKSKSFICDKCGYAAAHSFQYDLHMASHETERKFKCPHPGCKAAFKHLVILKSHAKRHEKKMVFECFFCNKRFPFYENIKRHILNSHSESSKFRKFSCEICGQRTGSASALLKHKISHTG
jgi:KRAB domain-containing zinc finger protein